MKVFRPFQFASLFGVARIGAGLLIALIYVFDKSKESGMLILLDVPTLALSFLTSQAFGWPEGIEGPLDPAFSLVGVPLWLLLGYGVGVFVQFTRR